MMPEPEKLNPGDAVLLRYLLGALPVDEAEPLEEASVVDEDFAARLNAMERDLVDSYVRGELEGSNLARFRSWYLSSPSRAERVEAAKAISRIADAAAENVSISVAPKVVAVPEAIAPAEASPTPAVSIVPKFSYGEASASQKLAVWRFGVFRALPILGFAAAALVLLAALGYLSGKNKELRKEVAETKKQSTALTAELDNQQVAAGTAGTGKVWNGLTHSIENVATVTMFLPAPTRAASTIPKIDVPAGTGIVVLSLGLGSGDEDNYRAQLMSPTTNKVLWHSGLLRPGSDGTYVSVAVPANVLRSQVYLIQLMHDAANGAPELLATYPFRVEVK
jgi:hypothetical protein